VRVCGCEREREDMILEGTAKSSCDCLMWFGVSVERSGCGVPGTHHDWLCMPERERVRH
jgi:hypothetical protein